VLYGGKSHTHPIAQRKLAFSPPAGVGAKRRHALDSRSKQLLASECKQKMPVKSSIAETCKI
jgi:hypothetical protein